MRAHRIKAHSTPGQPLVVPLPADAPDGEVDVIVLYPDAAGVPPRFAGLAEFDAWLRQQPASGRSKDAIDREIALERDSWQ